MEAAINNLVAKFKEYACKDGSNTLSPKEFHKLVDEQLPNYVKNPKDSAAVEQLMGSQDKNSDGELTFTEFWNLIGKLASDRDPSLD